MSKKYSSFKDFQLITENWRKFLNEKADPGQLDPERFPSKLSVVAQDPKDAALDAKSGVEDGVVDDDIINVNRGTWKVSDLGPSQSTMNVPKAVGMALGHILKGKAGGDLGAFISKDGRIMDGHHRWISSYMVDPNAQIGGFAVNFPSAQLIPVLNAVTVGALGRMEGKPGKGSFEDFNAGEIQKTIAALAAKGNQYADPGMGKTPEEVQAGLKKFTGLEGEEAVAAAAQKMADNLSTAKMNVPEGAVERIDMPVIDKEHVKLAIGLLQKGAVDVNPPYEKGAEEAPPEEK